MLRACVPLDNATQVALLTAAGFFAGLVDSMAGGGGLISLPALLAAGISPHMALGTNKIQSCFGTFFSTGRYMKERQMQLPMAVSAAVAALAGSFFGSKAALSLSSDMLSTIMPIFIVVVALITFFRKSFGSDDKFLSHTAKTLTGAGLLGAAVGFYDGFFGPGTGTFLAFGFVFFFGFGFVRANANAKLANLASNMAAVIVFSASGQVDWPIALVMAAANIGGNLVGSGLALRVGSKVIKPVFGFVLCLLFIKIVLSR